MDRANDEVSHPSHYTSGGIECIDAMESAASGVRLGPFAGFLWLNLFKYVFRWPRKNGLKDLRKADWYLKRLIAYVEKQGVVVNAGRGMEMDQGVRKQISD